MLKRAQVPQSSTGPVSNTTGGNTNTKHLSSPASPADKDPGNYTIELSEVIKTSKIVAQLKQLAKDLERNSDTKDTSLYRETKASIAKLSQAANDYKAKFNNPRLTRPSSTRSSGQR